MADRLAAAGAESRRKGAVLLEFEPIPGIGFELFRIAGIRLRRSPPIREIGRPYFLPRFQMPQKRTFIPPQSWLSLATR